MELTPGTDRSRLRRLSIPERGSERSRRTLERLANICTARDVDVTVRFTEDGSYCTPDADAGGAAYEVYIRTERLPQVRTDLPPRRWDRRVQHGLLFHELGHVKYSDFERLSAIRDGLAPEWREPFRRLANAAEDGAIEAQMAAEFDVVADFIVLNDTFAGLETRRLRAAAGAFDEGSLTYTVLEALVVGLLDRGFGDSGRFAEIVDPGCPDRTVRDGQREVVASLEPELDTFMDRTLSEPDGTERVELARSFFESVRPTLSELPRAQRTRLAPATPRPNDAEGAVGDPDRATALAADWNDMDVTDEAGPAAVGELTGADVASAAATLADADDDRLDDGESPRETEAAALLDIVEGSSGLDRAGVVEPEDGTGDRERWRTARRAGQRLARDLESRLRRRRRSRRRSGYRAGRIDSDRVVDVHLGDDRAFQRREPGDRRDYVCLIVLDRSGSMCEEEIAAAESATAQLAVAFDEVGVDVSVLSVYEDCPWLELPFGGAPIEHVDHLLRGDTGGGTPLSGGIEVARERVEGGDGHRPFVVVVTDGQPDDEAAYERTLAACNFHVYGVYLTDDGTLDGHESFFDRVTAATPETVDRTLRTLARALFADP